MTLKKDKLNWMRITFAAAVFILVTGVFGHVAKGAQNPGAANTGISDEDIQAFVAEVESTISAATQEGDQAVASFWRDRIADDADMWVSVTGMQQGEPFASGYMHLSREQAMQLLPVVMKAFEEGTENYTIDITLGQVTRIDGAGAVIVDTKISENFSLPAAGQSGQSKLVLSEASCEHLVLKEGQGPLKLGDTTCHVNREFLPSSQTDE